MEIKKSFAEFVWEYASTHDFVSRTVVSGLYMDTTIGNIQGGMGVGKSKQQKALERKASRLFMVMKDFGISEKFSQTTVKINRSVFNDFTLEDILAYRFD